MRSPTSAETSLKCGTEGCASGLGKEAEGDCAQRVKAEKSSTKETAVRLLILSGILALHCASQSRYAVGPWSFLFLTYLMVLSISFVQNPLRADDVLASVRASGS